MNFDYCNIWYYHKRLHIFADTIAKLIILHFTKANNNKDTFSEINQLSTMEVFMLHQIT